MPFDRLIRASHAEHRSPRQPFIILRLVALLFHYNRIRGAAPSNNTAAKVVQVKDYPNAAQ